MDITQYASYCKRQLSYCGMVSGFALRNMREMDKNGLKAARKRLNLRQPEIAERLGVSVPQVSRWESGKDNVPSYRLEAISQAYEASLNELFGGEVSVGYRPEGAERLPPIPKLGKVPAGNWKEAIRTSGQYINAPEPNIPANAYALEVEGDSMDKIAKEGTTIIIDPEDLDYFDKRLFVFRKDGETTFKQYREGPARLVPCSRNPEHQVIPVNTPDFELVGRVIWISLKPEMLEFE